jgi:hypothetical protein
MVRIFSSNQPARILKIERKAKRDVAVFLKHHQHFAFAGEWMSQLKIRRAI